MKASKQYPFFISLGILILIYIFLKFSGNYFITSLYSAQRFDTLNILSGLKGNPPDINVYIGRISDLWLGPLENIIAGVIFLIFSLKYLTHSSFKVWSLAVFSFLILSKWEVLSFPPYGDPVSGHWMEAIWLKRNGFNYVELLNQPRYALGGPKVYVFNFYPTFLALLMLAIPAKIAFLYVNHIVSFGLLALTAALFREILSKKCPPKTALLSSIFFISLPLAQSMSEVLNMEMPVLFFAVACCYFLTQKRMFLGGLMAILCAWAKGSGVISCIAFFCIAFLFIFFDKQPKARFRIGLWSLVVLFAGYSKFVLRKFIDGDVVDHNSMGLFVGIRPLSGCIVIIFLFISALISLFVIFLKDRKKLSFSNSDWAHSTTLIMYLMMILWFALYINFPVMGPRYKILLAPFLLYCVVWCFSQFCHSKRIQQSVLIFAILGACLGSYGLFYKPVQSSYYTYIHTERSLEYRNDLFLYQDIIQELKNKYQNYTIGSPWLLAHCLAFPELGYVEKPFNVMIYGHSISFGGVKTFNGLHNVNILKTIWVGYKSDYPEEIHFPIDPRYDQILKTIEMGNKKATLFMGGFGVERLRRIIFSGLANKQN